LYNLAKKTIDIIGIYVIWDQKYIKKATLSSNLEYIETTLNELNGVFACFNIERIKDAFKVGTFIYPSCGLFNH